MCWFHYKGTPGEGCLHQCLVVKIHTGVSTGQEMMLSAHDVFRVFSSWMLKLNLHCKPLKLPAVQKSDVKTIRFIYICLQGFFPLPFPLSAHCYLLNLSVPRQAVQIKGICYHLVFFLNGYTCGTSGSRPDSLLTFLCSILCSHGNCCMFGRKLLKAVEKERAEGGSIKGEQAREGGRADELSVVGLHPV